MGRILILLLVAGCTSTGTYTQDLMHPPTVFAEGFIDPFAGLDVGDSKFDVLYATDRVPSPKDDTDTPFYQHERAYGLRFGQARIALTHDDDMTWDEAKAMTLSSERKRDYELVVTGVEEFGVYRESVHPFLRTEEMTDAPAKRFAGIIDERLARSAGDDVFVYVHGYKAEFTYPVLVAAELWHFTGFRGVFIGYSWPSTPNPTAYFKDIETARQTARHLRQLLEFLSANTKAKRIHVLGYSAGTRVVTSAINQLALLHHGKTKEQIGKELRLGHVILVGADVDRDLMRGYVADGFLEVPQTFTIYQSESDNPLGLAKWLFKRPRAGQFLSADADSPQGKKFVESRDDFFLIDVSKAEAAASGNGHGYFLKSPWASSDILLTILFDDPPGERGLVKYENSPIWRFPDDYVARLKKLYGTRKMQK